MSVAAPEPARLDPVDAASGRLLLVAHHFPPDFTIGALRPRRMAIHLRRLGWEVHVLSVRPMYFDAVDEGVCRGLEGVRVHRTQSLSPRRWLRLLRRPVSGEAGTPAPAGAGGPQRGPFANPFATALEIPDRWSGWIPVAVAVGAFLPRPDVILATAPAFSNLLVGAALTVRFGVPLVLDYRDPWNPQVRRRAMPAWRRRTEAALEAWCVGRASEIVATTPGLAAEVAEVAARPVRVVTNACEPERFQGVVARRFDRPTLVYAGGLYGDRTLDPVLDALARLRAAGRLGPDRLQILYMGRTADVAARSADARGLGDFMRIEGTRPNAEALAASAGATCNLSIVGVEHARLVPAKIFEHLVAGRPMLVVAPPGSDTQTLLRDVPWVRCVAPDDGAALERALLDVAAGDAQAPSAAIPPQLTAESTMKALHDLLLSARRG